MKEHCKWHATILILCAVGLLKEFRPSGPFFVDYATEYRNLTLNEVTHDILPSTTKAYIVSLVLLLFVTDVLCYKPIIILGGIATVLTWIITIWFFNGVQEARGRQMAYGVSVVATELAYFTYMYSSVEKKDYKKVTSYTHSAVHMGQFLSGFIGQVIFTFHFLSLDEMNYLSLGGGIAGLLLAFFLPRVLNDVVVKNENGEDGDPMNPKEETKEDKEKDLEPEKSNDDKNSDVKKAIYTRKTHEPPMTRLERLKRAPSKAKENFMYAYSNCNVRKWSIWWAFSYGLYIQVDLYAESLWTDIHHHSHRDDRKVYNGLVHASHSLISAGLAILVGRLKMCWLTWGGLIFGVGAIVQGASLFFMSQTDDLYIAYGCFILFQTVFQVLVIVSKFEIAEEIKENTEAFIFGINTLMAVIIQAGITLAITSQHGFKLAIREQYIVLGGYAVLLGLGFLIYALPHWSRRSWNINGHHQQNEKNKKDEHHSESIDMPTSMPYSIPREH